MSKYEQKNKVLHQLLSIPKKNLEAKLLELEDQIIKRNELSDNFLTKLLTYKRQLKRLKHALRYQPNDIHNQIVQLESHIQKEELSCFRDVAELTEKINTLQEELHLSKVKFKLLDDELP